MKKALNSWSGMRKYLESEMLAPELSGRVRYSCSTGVGMDGCRFFEIYIDDKCFKRFSWETVNSYFIAMGFAEKPDPMSVHDYWDGFWQLLAAHPMEDRTEYTDGEFCRALEQYRNCPIAASIRSADPIVCMFALLDRRVGKRTLEKLRDELAARPAWLRELYRIRTGEAPEEKP
ncbi:MAG: hypothetical protein II072_08205 [Clostridia bacterium]|nr:hypothetical protein [Clostridia bacterium]MBQ2191801.1 hypothetical protein [Clostridia bacterium]MBQ3937862.1 hypothetical protein [Clostridia bacterium]MBQ5488426.1 hypothetical protein [Clostridia bacterium]MBR4635104.1 hypothetical protein [Clostridia bacterium]